MKVIDISTSFVTEVGDEFNFIKSFEMVRTGTIFRFDSGETLYFFYDEHSDRCVLLYEKEDMLKKWWITPNNYKLGAIIIIIKEGGKGEMYALGSSQSG